MRIRITMLLLVLALAVQGAPALAAPGDANLLGQEEATAYSPSVEAAVAAGEAVYILLREYDEGAYAWKYNVYRYVPAQGAQAEKVCGDVCYTRLYPDLAAAGADRPSGMRPEEGFGYLFADGETLYGFNTLTGSVARLAFADGAMTREEVCAVNLSALCMQDGTAACPADIHDPATMDGHVYFTLMDRRQEEPVCRLFDISLQDGSVRDTVLAEQVNHLTAYGDGLLLGCTLAGWHDAAQAAVPAALAAIDTRSGAVTRLQEWPDDRDMRRMAYDRGAGTLYYASPGILWAMPGLGQPQKAAYTNVTAAGGLVVTDAGYAAVWDAGTLEIRCLDPAYLPGKTLTLMGVWQADAKRKFLREHPDVPLLTATDYLDPSALGREIAAGGSPADIVCYFYQEGFEALRDSGCCADLSASRKLMDYAASLYPALRDAVLRDGRLYAIPVELTGTTLCYQPDKLAEIGLTPEDLPTTFAGLCEFITRWNNEWIHDANKADVLPFCTTQSNRSMVLELMFQAYLAYCDAQGEPLRFDTPVFNAMLAALDGMDASNLDLPANMTDQEYDAYYQRCSGLFLDYGLLSRSEGDNAAVPLRLSIAPGLDCAIPVYMHVMFVNANCPNLPEAIAFLECQTDALDVAARMRLCPGCNEPVEDPFYGETIRDLEESLAGLREQLQNAGNAQKPELEEVIGYHENALEHSEALRWIYSQATIARYREIGDCLFPQPANALYSAGDEILSRLQALHDRYGQRQITREQYIQELEKLVAAL